MRINRAMKLMWKGLKNEYIYKNATEYYDTLC